MTDSRPLHTFYAFLTALGMVLSLFASVAMCADDDETVGLFNAWQDQPSTASRAPKPLSRTAENVTVVTAAEIEAINAHTLADVLATIPGIQTDHQGGPGNIAFTFIQSSSFNHVLVLLDGTPLNNIENFSDVSQVPARIIERVEVVKGAASSVWGQALGGVINVITKSPERGRPLGGSVSASIGNRTTTDEHFELAGTSGRLGYYLAGGYLGSDGLIPNSQLASNNGYAKLVYDLPGSGQIWGTLNYARADVGGAQFDQFNLKTHANARYLYANLGFRRQLSDRLELELLAHHSARNNDISVLRISDNLQLNEVNSRERYSGGEAKLIWRGTSNLLVAGTSYEHAEFNSSSSFVRLDTLNRMVDQFGFYLNDTLTLGPVTVIPGARYDRTGFGDQFSPSLGFTWQATDALLVRGYTARGYSLRTIGFDNPPEKVWSSQIGIESQVATFLWLKGSLFRNETWNILVPTQSGERLSERHLALGGELEARTTPVLDTSLAAGYTYTNTTRTSDGSQVLGAPRHTLHLALHYDDHVLFRGVLNGRHIMWNTAPGSGGSYGGLVWNLYLGARLLKREQSALELFFSGHNLFDNARFSNSPNTGRWFEGGMKVTF